MRHQDAIYELSLIKTKLENEPDKYKYEVTVTIPALIDFIQTMNTGKQPEWVYYGLQLTKLIMSAIIYFTVRVNAQTVKEDRVVARTVEITRALSNEILTK